MTRSSAPAARPRRAAWLPAAGLLAALLAFAGGWLAANLSTAAPAGRVASAGASPSSRSAGPAPRVLPGEPAAAPAGPGQVAEAGPAGLEPIAAPEPLARAAAQAGSRAGRPTPELVATVTEAARQGLEAARADLVARCVPAERLAAGASAAPFTFSLTFDASGREIARGIGEDRRRRAPEVASCLRRLPLGSLRVPPPGASVGVRVALSLP